MGFAASDRHDAAHASNVRRSHLSFWPATLEDVGDFIQQGVMAAGDHQRPANVIQTADQLDVYQIAGFVFGQCTDCNPGDGYGSLTLEQILDDYIKPLGVPAYRGAMIGHVREQFIVPVGGPVEMDADAGAFRMTAPLFA